MKLKFEWDAAKAAANARKHGVTFDEATSIFFNLPLETFYDPDHSDDEDRFIAAGFSDRRRVLLVVHCENKTGTVITIISARKATRRERETIFKE